MCFICPFTLQSAERVFRSLHLKCHCINSSLKQHNTQTLADLLGFLIPTLKDIEVLVTMTKYFTEVHISVGDRWFSDIGQRALADVRSVISGCQILKTIPQNFSQVLEKESKKYRTAWEIKDSKHQAWKWGRCPKQELEVQHSPCCYTQEPSSVWVQLLALGTLGKLQCEGRKVKITKFLRTHFIKQRQIQDLDACQGWSGKQFRRDFPVCIALVYFWALFQQTCQQRAFSPS